MAVELDHSFTTERPIDESFAVDQRPRAHDPVRRGRRRVLERTGPDSVKAQIKVKMGAMSMTFTGTVEVAEQDPAAHRVVLDVKSREAGGQGHANATVEFALHGGRGRHPHERPDHRQGGVDGGGRRRGRARRDDHGLRRQGRRRSEAAEGAAVAMIAMREIRAARCPIDGGTAIQEDPGRPVFHGNGPGRLRLRRVRQRAGRGDGRRADDEEGAHPLRRLPTVNVAVIEPEPDRRSAAPLRRAAASRRSRCAG